MKPESRRHLRRASSRKDDGNHVRAYKPSPNALRLPRGPVTVNLDKDTHLDGRDLRRFVSEGGTVQANGFRVFVSGEFDLLDLGSVVD